MKYSSKIEKCGLSPMRKFAPYAAEAVKNGKKVYHLNIGQPDTATPEAVRQDASTSSPTRQAVTRMPSARASVSPSERILSCRENSMSSAAQTRNGGRASKTCAQRR